MTLTLDLKKILIISVAVLALILGVLLVYNFFFKAAPEAPAPPITEEPIPPGQPEQPFVSPTKKLNAISQVAVVSPTISADGQKVKYYSKENGNVFESKFNGTGLTRISSAVLPDILKILWSPDKNKVISVFKDAQTGVKKYYYNYQTGSSKPLNQSIKQAAWSPDGSKIAYQFFDETAVINNISASDPDGSDWKNVLPTRLRDLIIEWPKRDIIAFRTKPSGLAPSILYGVDPGNGKITNVLSHVFGLSVLWSPNGEKLIYSRTDENGKNLTLAFSDWKGETSKDVNISTFAEKCAWSQDNRTIFCAVPTILPDNAVLPDDYYKNILNISDEIWQMNLDTGEKTKIDLGQDIAIDANELILNSQEEYLLFINRKDGLLYSLRL